MIRSRGEVSYSLLMGLPARVHPIALKPAASPIAAVDMMTRRPVSSCVFYGRTAGVVLCGVVGIRRRCHRQ